MLTDRSYSPTAVLDDGGAAHPDEAPEEVRHRLLDRDVELIRPNALLGGDDDVVVTVAEPVAAGDLACGRERDPAGILRHEHRATQRRGVGGLLHARALVVPVPEVDGEAGQGEERHEQHGEEDHDEATLVAPGSTDDRGDDVDHDVAQTALGVGSNRNTLWSSRSSVAPKSRVTKSWRILT